MFLHKYIDVILLLISTLFICFSTNYVFNLIGVATLTSFTMIFMRKIYKVKTNKHVLKGTKLLLLQYVLLYFNVYLLTQRGFTIAQWLIHEIGLWAAGVYFLLISILIVLWMVLSIIWVFRIPKYFNLAKASILVFGILIAVLWSSTVYYANIMEDYNHYYSVVEPNDERGLFLSDGNRVETYIDYLYFSSTLIFTIGYDDVSVVGPDLKIIVASEMFMSYLLMCIFVPSIFTLLMER